MVTMVSSIPALKAALVSRLSADSDLSGVGVSWGNPYPNRASAEAVFIGGASAQPVEYLTAMSSANENYTLTLLVSVIGNAQTPYQSLEERAYEIADAVNASVLSWDGYDGCALRMVPGDFSDEESIDGDAREASITLTFDVTARI